MKNQSSLPRRTVVRGAAWTVPVVAVAAAAPAFAVSRPVCNVTAECKLPGEGSNTKDYAIRSNCGADDSNIESVLIYTDTNNTKSIDAVLQGDGTFLAKGFKDSRAYRTVQITFNTGPQTYNVYFPPC